MTERVFLPATQDDQLVVFEYRRIAQSKRHEFQLVARVEGVDPAPTGASTLSRADLDHCRELIAAWPEIDAALGHLRLGHPDGSAETLDALNRLGGQSGSAVLTLALHLELVRHVALFEASLRDYRAMPPEGRVRLGLTASIYEGVLKLDRREMGLALLKEDSPAFPAKPDSAEWAYTFKLAATICERGGDQAAALYHLRRAVATAPDAGLWCRIGDLAHATGDHESAVDAFLTSHEISPLSGPRARRLAWWYVDAEDAGSARKWYSYAQTMGLGDMPQLAAALRRLEPSEGV